MDIDQNAYQVLTGQPFGSVSIPDLVGLREVELMGSVLGSESGHQYLACCVSWNGSSESVLGLWQFGILAIRGIIQTCLTERVGWEEDT